MPVDACEENNTNEQSKNEGDGKMGSTLSKSLPDQSKPEENKTGSITEEEESSEPVKENGSSEESVGNGVSEKTQEDMEVDKEEEEQVETKDKDKEETPSTAVEEGEKMVLEENGKETGCDDKEDAMEVEPPSNGTGEQEDKGGQENKGEKEDKGDQEDKGVQEDKGEQAEKSIQNEEQSAEEQHPDSNLASSDKENQMESDKPVESESAGDDADSKLKDDVPVKDNCDTEGKTNAVEEIAKEKTEESGMEIATIDSIKELKEETEGEKDEKKSSEDKKNGEDKKKNEDSDSDDDRPQIFLRDFSEITERDSDEDDDDVQPIFYANSPLGIAPPPPANAPPPALKTYVARRKSSRLAEITTTDDSFASVDLTVQPDKFSIRTKQKKPLGRACTKITKWLKRQVTQAASSDSTSSPAVLMSNSILRPPNVTADKQSRLTFNTVDNTTGWRSIFKDLPSEKTLNQNPVSTSQIYYDRAAGSRGQQTGVPISLISGSGTLTPGTTIIAQPMSSIQTTMWQPQSQVRPSVSISQVRNGTAVTSVNSAPRPTTLGNNQTTNVLNVPSPFTQLIFDPSTGYLLCPTNQNCQIIQQQPTSVQQQRPNSNQQIRLQNGMIIQQSNPPYNVRNNLGNRNGLDFPLSTVPLAGQQPQRLQLQQQRPTAPIRPYSTTMTIQRQPLSHQRPQRPPLLPLNQQAQPRQSITVAQQLQQQRIRNVAPAPIRGPPPPVRFPSSVRASSPQMQQRPPMRTVSPQPQRAPFVRPNIVAQPRVNGIPVAQPVKPTSAAPPPVAVAEAANVTAGNQKPIPGSVEDEGDMQNKTFPSLVVQVKTCLTAKPNRQQQTKSRSDLDASVKSVLIHNPAKFAEWMMRRGLVKLDHFCDIHQEHPFKLGMYSEPNRQPFSGGYIWTADCCPDRHMSVFTNSIFEGSKYPPGTVLKLMYHWACQTPANNVLQWVKVSSLYLKNFFTLLRAVCISWMHEQCPPLGGDRKYVEIGVITLGSSAETSRGLKNVNVEILGVFDPTTKIIRMKVINSMQGQLFKEKSKGGKPDVYEQGARAFQILWPLTHWVDKRSILLVDGIIDRALFLELGFKNIQQCGEGVRSPASNTNVMNYLRNLVPKMFSSTLSVLSKSIVQQFLDELSWREMYGQNVLSSYENLLDHIGAMTKWNLKGETLISRLNKINQNPFVDWSYTKQIRRCPLNTVPLSLRNEPGIRECVRHVMKDEKKPLQYPQMTLSSIVNPPPPPTTTYPPAQKPAQKRKLEDLAQMEKVAKMNFYKEVYASSPKIHSLQSYYYGSVRAEENLLRPPSSFPQNLKCPMCTRTFTGNGEVCRHLYTHIGSVTYRGSESSVCRICLKELPAGVTMLQHVNMAHTMVGFNTTCRICEERFKTEEDLVVHMWDLHQRRETPYKCALCSYTSSFHYYVVQHHHEKHGAEAEAMCPFCLKIFSVSTVPQLNQLINHLSAHAQMTRRAKKCPRCVLTFLTDVDLELHIYEHRSQEPTERWIPYLLPPNEANVKMATPPPSRTPLKLTAPPISQTFSAPPPVKKQKLNNAPKKKAATLNANFAVPIDTNEKFGGSKYKINVPQGSKKAICGECEQDIQSPNHFIGRLICTKCRYNTACQAAMDLHHTKNHLPGSNSTKLKPGMKTKTIEVLAEPLNCRCGFSSNHPYRLADHLISCDKITVYPRPRTPPPPSETEKENTSPPKSPPPSQQQEQEPPSQPAPLSPMSLLDHGPVTTFDDMLSLEESMASTLEALALPSLLSPSEPMPTSPISMFEHPPPASSNNQPKAGASQTSTSGNNESSSWDDEAWQLPLS